MIQGLGLGFRRELASHLLGPGSWKPSFIELAPENWIGVGGRWGRLLRQAAEQYPILCHGLSMSLGSPDPLDRSFLKEVKAFLQQTPAVIYSEHLSYSKCHNAHLYDLLPLPFREDAVKHVAARIREAQEFLERRIAIENVSYYMPIAPEMDESSFIKAVLEEADCDLLLDVNNVYVNSVNHGYDAREFVEKLPLERVVYVHMAGHEQRSHDLIIDTHGEPIAEPVFELFEWVVERIQPVPVLLERDFNFPDYSELVGELERLQGIVDRYWVTKKDPAHVA